jgi:pyruvate kinase
MLLKSQRRTGVVWSFESSTFNADLTNLIVSEDPEAIRLVPQSGQFGRTVEYMQELRDKLLARGRKTPIIVDIFSRVGAQVKGIKGKKELLFDEEVTFSLPGKDGDFEIGTSEWEGLFKKGFVVYLGNGAVVLKVVEAKDVVRLKVAQGGAVHMDMAVHIPEANRSPRFADIPKEDIDVILKNRVDCVMIPGFVDSKDIKLLTEGLAASPSPPWVLLKVSSEEVYKNLESLLPFVKGVVISRVELAMSVDPARVPMMTKEIIRMCNNQAKIVLVASEILGSMRHNATPTRAEVSDIANAVFDGADGVVLSEDLAHGRFAQRGLMLAKKTIADAESEESYVDLAKLKDKSSFTDTLAAITFSAYRTAHRNRAKALVCITKEGNTALLLASFRTPIPVIAVTMTEDVVRRLGLVRGVNGMLLEALPSIDDVLPLINEKLTKDSWLKPGDKIVFVSVTISSIGETASNLFTIQTLK